MGDPLEGLLLESGQRNLAAGTSRYDRDPEMDRSLFELQAGFIPSMRLGHFMGMRGLPATLVDIGTDLPWMIGPAFLEGLAKNISTKGVMRTVGEAPSEMKAALAAAKGTIRESAVANAIRVRDYSRRFTDYLARPKGVVPPKAQEIEDLFDKAARSVVGNPSMSQLQPSIDPASPIQNAAELRGIHDEYIADVQWNDLVSKTLKDRLKTSYTGPKRKLLYDVMNDPEKYLDLPPIYAMTKGDISDVLGELRKLRSERRSASGFGRNPLAKEKQLKEELQRLRLQRDMITFDPVYLKKPYLSQPGEVSDAKITPDDLAVVNGWRRNAPQMSQYLAERGLIQNVVEEYVGRVVTKIKKPAEFGTAMKDLATKYSGPQTLSRFSRHFLGRKVPEYETLKKLRDAGVIEFDDDVANVLPEVYRSVGKAAADDRALERLASFKRWNNETGQAVPMMVFHEDDIPKGLEHLYARTDVAPAIAAARRAAIFDVKKMGGQVFGRLNRALDDIARAHTVTPDPVKAAREIDRAEEELNQVLDLALHGQKAPRAWVLKEDISKLQTMWGKGLAQRPKHELTGGQKVWRTMMLMNGIAKRISLFASGFHFVALIESGVADLGWEFIKHPWKAWKFGVSEIHRASDITELAVRSGLQIGPTLDAEREVVDWGLGKAEQWLNEKRLGRPFGAMLTVGRKASEKWDRALWDYYHNGLKMFAFSEIMQDAQVRFAGKMGYHDIARSVAQHVNSSFGGINWDRFFFSSHGRDALRLTLFAPDWTLSNLLTAADVFSRSLGFSPRTAIPLGQLIADEPRAYYARQYAWRSRMYLSIFANFANYAFTGYKHWLETGDFKGHWMEDNEKTASGRIEMPWNDANGKRQYYRLGKHFNEMTRLIKVWEQDGGPYAFLKGKLASLPRYFLTTVSGYDSLGRPIVTAKDGPVEAMAKKFGFNTMAEAFMPANLRALGLIAAERAGIIEYKRRAMTPVPNALMQVMGFPTGPAPRERGRSDPDLDSYTRWLRGRFHNMPEILDALTADEDE